MLICYSDYPDLFNLPVQYAPLSQQVGDSYLILERDDLSFYKNGVKFISAKDCYNSLLQDKHQSTIDILKRKGRLPQQVVDGTGGWGRDALTFAQAGITVLLYEQHELPVIFLKYALQRWFPSLQKKITIHHQCFSTHSLTVAECVYLDPMFFDDKKSLSKKSMQSLYELFPSDKLEQFQTLKSGLLKLKIETLVTKQPKHASSWIQGIMKHERFNRTCRFDIYYINNQLLNETHFRKN